MKRETSDAKWLKERDRQARLRGYDDGYAGRPAVSSLAVYQAGWRRGREAREAGNDAA